ncbi:MAG: hypothetical protein KJO41_11625 [Bacteroidia bacterium]|nr:hypothetical protein [Bacteroidia bacterium]NND25347.1 hypothetical protein [Flavobacteriaceae bacterium]MBT8279647.1 hypothetical protein [Bacteroidia bacterium]NNK60306.1 hypothetical protein [Flavobacteriaceae bacterium]NNL33914.1 hypothetical protein [Flavobacteriaceae bacterium]
MRFVSTLFVCLFCVPLVQAQEDFAMIRKNVNILAKHLNHDLSPSKDSLLLSSKKKIFRVYTVGGYSGLIDHKISTKKFAVPLKRLRKGKYVFVVDQLNLKIVFQIHILRNYNDIDDFIDQEDAIVSAEVEAIKPEAADLEKIEVKEPEPVVAQIETPGPTVQPEREKVAKTKLAVAKSSVQLTKEKQKIADVKVVKKAVIKPEPIPKETKSYNLTDLERDNMQSRKEARQKKTKSKDEKSTNNSNKQKEK